MAPSLETVPSHEVHLPVLIKDKSSATVQSLPVSKAHDDEVKDIKNGTHIPELTQTAVQRPLKTFELEDHPIDAPSKIRVRFL
ncbi:MAG: hypothetical protein CL912_11840 [Deltaproteobacteria bacterium]|nr:hypothetical protein [Deltaproteobacteria bacterium]|tara:strand:+ start:970 stop:1218 length:249 start_codon:yes stop_codon:yes gene_type:complete